MNKVCGNIGAGLVGVLGVLIFGVLITVSSGRSQPRVQSQAQVHAQSQAQLQAQPARPANAVDEIVILKSARTMSLENGGHILKTYKVALGRQPVGAKDREGDHKTPEGEYTVDAKNSHSDYYLALHLSYPSEADRVRTHAMGVNAGGDVEIHGLPKGYGWIGAGHRLMDWTDGCIAVTNNEIEEIFGMVPVGTRVEIKP